MDVFDYLAASGYPSRLTAAAAQLVRRSETLRSRAALLERASGQCQWDGAGARAFRTRQSTTTGRLRRAADLLDEAAGLLRGHAGAVAADVARWRPR